MRYGGRPWDSVGCPPSRASAAALTTRESTIGAATARRALSPGGDSLLAGYHALKLYLHLLLRRPELRPLAWRVKRLLIGGCDQYVVIEHPKCGRTWLRYMIHQAEAIACGVPLRNTMYEVWYRQHALPRVNYVHGFKPGRPLAERAMAIGTGDPRQKGFILLVRQPERVMISYYHQLAFRERVFEGTLAEFIRDPHHGIDNYVAWVEHYHGALQAVPHLVVTYERLRADTEGELAALLRFVGLPLPPEAVARIVENSSLDRMRELEERRSYDVGWLLSDSGDPRARKVRSGGSEALAESFSGDDLRFLASRYERSQVFARLGYSAAAAGA